jgi:hypothetical protein
MSCPTCQIVDCVNPSDFEFYNLNDGTIFTNPRYAFVMDCPPGYACHGNYPITIVIDQGTIHLPVPPNPTVIRLACCQSEIVRNVPANATAADIAAIAAEVVRLCAAQQAACDVRTNPPGPGLPPPTPISPPDNPTTRTDIWNTKQQLSAECGSGNTGTVTSVIAARTYGTTLFNATAAQIVAQQAALDSIALNEATLRLAGLAPIITTSALANAIINQEYSATIQEVGGTAPLTFGIVTGSLPTGLSMDSDGNISGTPTVQQLSTFTVAVLDAIGNQCSKEISLQVEASATWCDDAVTKRVRIQGYAASMFLMCPDCFIDASPGETWDGTFPTQTLIPGLECKYQKICGTIGPPIIKLLGNVRASVLAVSHWSIDVPPYDANKWYVEIYCYQVFTNSPVWRGYKLINTPEDNTPIGTYIYESGCSSGLASVTIEAYDP